MRHTIESPDIPGRLSRDTARARGGARSHTTDGKTTDPPPRRWGMQSMTRLGDDKASRAAWRLMTDEDIPPF